MTIKSKNTPVCRVCGRLFFLINEDGSGFCPDCRARNDQFEQQIAEMFDVQSSLEEQVVEELIKPGKYGVTNLQLLSAIRQAIAEDSIEKLKLLKKSYLYKFSKVQKYLNKSEIAYLAKNSIIKPVH